MQIERITFIGGGHMATALVGGLCAQGFDPKRITVTARSPARLRALRERFGVNATTDNPLAVSGADVVVLAVKPQNLMGVLDELSAGIAAQRPLVVSVAAGKTVAAITQALGGYENVVRAMPNRPALLGKGITALYAPPPVDEAARDAVARLMQAAGETVWLQDEELMDVATAVSGSGPAYFFLLMELLEEAGIQLGLAPEIARQLAVQTAYGAACMAMAPGAEPALLRAQVTSPAGTTAAALAVLENADLRGIVRRAVAAAARRAAQLAQEN